MDGNTLNEFMMPTKKKNRQNSTMRLYGIAWVITLSSLVWGYSISVLNVCLVNNAKGSLLVDINLSETEQEIATALVLVGAWIGSLCTSTPADQYGRKPVLLFTNLLYLMGTLCCSLAMSRNAIYAGRILIGLACGGVTGVVPTLLTEIAPTSMRGKITTLHQLQLTVGILLSGVLGYFYVTDVPSGWRYVNGFMVLPVIMQCILFTWIPESPRWLASRNRKEEVRKTLFSLRRGTPSHLIENEMAELLQKPRTEKMIPSWKTVFSYQKPMLIGSALVFFQAMTGINSVIFYSAKVFHFAGVDNAIAATASVGTVNVVVTAISVHLVDKYGRRRLLVIGTIILTISLACLSASLFFMNENLHLQGIMAVICTLSFVAGFAVGFGAVIWVILGEILPTRVRSRSMGFFMAISYLCNIFIATGTLSVIHWLGTGEDPEKNGIAKLYFIFFCIALCSLLFILKMVPETKNNALDTVPRMDLEEIGEADEMDLEERELLPGKI